MQDVVIENIKESFKSVRTQLLRTILTVLIIAIGICALVGILTSIDAIKTSISSNFSSMGSNTFSIKNEGSNIRMGKRGKKAKVYPVIDFQDARDFKTQFSYPSVVSISSRATATATLKYESEKTNPNIFVFGCDENYTVTSGYEIAEGRNFSISEVNSGAHVVIIGHEIRTTLFGNNSEAIDKIISIGSGKYRVVGVLKEKGSSMGFSADKNALIPLQNARQYFSSANTSYLINVMVNQPEELDGAIGEATGAFRVVRGDGIKEESSFEISRSDSVANLLIENLSMVSFSAYIIGFITLLGAAIGLMNIMLVTVTERTKEIGVRKALGASSRIIMMQFLVEAVIVCQLGGAVGIVLGIIIGNVVSGFVGAGFIIPWDWMILGVILCLIVGVVSGIYPAQKAASLDPIESLRYE
ncbi:ABC transporter permease [Acidiluteibacter ferrifornacis]|jgi:putative ABC transport system permease protein|uniref:FtsX-like permease family protein n=1 Tax=Acidiluteibacter ferrifornacis TaxID=2692424 RepID=A0A6N9NNB3_9FLAO|nr:ABC transporter permease [Acidiluteibacter ferrifornacis]NBG66005.1 FtsX-like permease family protein [Acidiluteibacter ferrifornacis]